MTSLKSNYVKGVIYLIIAGMVWGVGLVAQKVGSGHMGPFLFTGARCFLGGIALLPLVIYKRKKDNFQKTIPKFGKYTELKCVAVCSLLLLSFIMCQQIGIEYTSVGKSGFITALYIIIAPIIGIILGKKVRLFFWVCVGIALLGFYMLTMQEGFSAINFGDFLMFVAAFLVAIHMYFIEYFVRFISPLKIASYQFMLTGAVAFTCSLIFEEVSLDIILDGGIAILYSGLISCGVGYTCQFMGQQHVEPNKAALLLSLETIFTLLAGMLFFGEVLEFGEYVGCALVFFAIVLSQLNNNESIDKVKPQ